ncbi:MAG: molybdopterin molybdenumtransferase MoeA [Deltaproteobacteria bacterium]|jgi:molybdopterin molybdotransferase/putative molybdopterin biosynthesis protein|nr:molybdopterin molybdenumtransferase MoeA [Deltaproteobacteria bacterium]
MKIPKLPSREEVLELLEKNWTPPYRRESIDVTKALNRVPARDYYSLNTLPLVRSAVMDGYAVKSALFKDGPPSTDNWELERDYARADMGDDFSDDFDAVIMVEEVAFEGSRPIFKPELAVVAGLNVRPSGSQLALGQLLVKKHRPLIPKDLALLQMGGHGVIEVIKKPLVAFMPTGRELIVPGLKPQRGQNVDTNSLLVSQTLKLMGAECWAMPIVSDDPALLEESLFKALAVSDVVIINGGSSKGGEDYNARILEKSFKSLVVGVGAAPGRPLGIFLAGEKLVINLPGPMIAAYFGLEWCLNFVINKFLHRPPIKRRLIQAKLIGPIEGPKGLSILFNVELSLSAEGVVEAEPLDPRKAQTWRGVGAGGQYITSYEGESLKAGDFIMVEVLREEEAPFI